MHSILVLLDKYCIDRSRNCISVHIRIVNINKPPERDLVGIHNARIMKIFFRFDCTNNVYIRTDGLISELIVYLVAHTNKRTCVFDNFSLLNVAENLHLIDQERGKFEIVHYLFFVFVPTSEFLVFCVAPMLSTRRYWTENRLWLCPYTKRIVHMKMR